MWHQLLLNVVLNTILYVFKHCVVWRLMLSMGFALAMVRGTILYLYGAIIPHIRALYNIAV